MLKRKNKQRGGFLAGLIALAVVGLAGAALAASSKDDDEAKEPPDPNKPDDDGDTMRGKTYSEPGDFALGHYFRITPKHNSLFKATSAFYGTKGQENYQKALMVRNHPYNARFLRYIPSEENLWPDGKGISYLPEWSPSGVTQYEDDGGSGNAWAVFYVPIDENDTDIPALPPEDAAVSGYVPPEPEPEPDPEPELNS